MVYSFTVFKIWAWNYVRELIIIIILPFSPLSANFTKWSNALNQFVGNLPTNCLSVFNHLVGLALKGLGTHVITEKTSFFSKGIFEQIGPLYRQFQLIWILLPPDFCKSCCKLNFHHISFWLRNKTCKNENNQTIWKSKLPSEDEKITVTCNFSGSRSWCKFQKSCWFWASFLGKQKGRFIF